MDEPNVPSVTPDAPTENRPRKLPDESVCRTLHMGVADLYLCLVDSPTLCPHVLPYGGKDFCLHPGRLKFASPAPEK